jgi:hypothetical protein
MNSREKGKRGERQWRDELREQGFAARRGQQFSGGAESPDVVCDSLPWMHFEASAAIGEHRLMNVCTRWRVRGGGISESTTLGATVYWRTR